MQKQELVPSPRYNWFSLYNSLFSMERMQHNLVLNFWEEYIKFSNRKYQPHPLIGVLVGLFAGLWISPNDGWNFFSPGDPGRKESCADMQGSGFVTF